MAHRADHETPSSKAARATAPAADSATGASADRPVPDSLTDSWVERAPARARPYLRLARWDRPVGFWLLSLPALMGVALARLDGALAWPDLAWAAVMLFGAAATRGAGCTYNDIVDRDLDAAVARTADRPLAAGVVSVRAAWVFFAAQTAAAFLAFLVLPGAAKLAALAAIPVIAAYPFMKRLTAAPQAWLGLAMSWGALVGFAAAAGRFEASVFVLFAGLWAWTFGYDTIYAHMDREDDTLIGVGSTARLFGDKSRVAVGASYIAAVVLVGLGAWTASGPRPVTALTAGMAAIAFGAPLLRQVRAVDFASPAQCLVQFRANVAAGARLTAALAFGGVLARLL